MTETASKNSRDYVTLHPSDPRSQTEFQYGNMLVRRVPLQAGSKAERNLVGIFESYKSAGVLANETKLAGDYLEHTLLKENGNGEEKAGRYLGIIFPDGQYHYVRLEGESLGLTKQRLSPPDKIDLMTDTCLFSTSCAIGVLGDGSKVSLVAPKTEISIPLEELHISDRLCLYEADSIVRLTDFINSVKTNLINTPTMFMAMPTVEYYFYLIEAYNQGLVAERLMQEWIRQVDVRAERIAGAFAKRTDLQVKKCQPLDSVEHYIKERIGSGSPVDFEMVKAILSHESKLWRDVFSVAGPVDWKSLNHVNYAIAVLEAASVREDENRLTVYIENPSEQRIMRHAAGIVKRLNNQVEERQFRMLGMYPHEKVFVAGDPASREFERLYYLDESQFSLGNYAKDVLRLNDMRVD